MEQINLEFEYDAKTLLKQMIDSINMSNTPCLFDFKACFENLKINILLLDNVQECYHGSVKDIEESYDVLLQKIPKITLRFVKKSVHYIMRLLNNNAKTYTLLYKAYLVGSLREDNLERNGFIVFYGDLITSLLLYFGFFDYPFQTFIDYKLKTRYNDTQYVHFDYLIKYKDKIVFTINCKSDNNDINVARLLVIALLEATNNDENIYQKNNDEIVLNSMAIDLGHFCFFRLVMSSKYKEEFEYLKESTSFVNVSRYPSCGDSGLSFADTGDREKIVIILTQIKNEIINMQDV